jgi:hypothetical protein
MRSAADRGGNQGNGSCLGVQVASMGRSSAGSTNFAKVYNRSCPREGIGKV